MGAIRGLGRAGAPAAGRARAGAGGFSVGDVARAGAADAGASASAASGAAAAAGLAGLLALQEGETDAARDRAARAHGDALLKELSALQAGLLAGADDPAALRRLASLADAAPQAADPGLRGLLRAASLRARVELARRAGAAIL